jgi:hypothetical protein
MGGGGAADERQNFAVKNWHGGCHGSYLGVGGGEGSPKSSIYNLHSRFSFVKYVSSTKFNNKLCNDHRTCEEEKSRFY